jgi:hypothetical protein
VPSDIPRPEYPRPQFARDDWLCLNGTWQFECDPGDPGIDRGLLQQELAGEIVVPFCPESPLSGIGDPGFHQAVWYRRRFSVPDAWRGRRLLLHFQAVDHDTTVWVNGTEAGSAVATRATAALEKVMVDQLPVMPLNSRASQWAYDTKQFTGWPTSANPYAFAEVLEPNAELVMLHLRIK